MKNYKLFPLKKYSYSFCLTLGVSFECCTIIKEMINSGDFNNKICIIS